MFFLAVYISQDQCDQHNGNCPSLPQCMNSSMGSNPNANLLLNRLIMCQCILVTTVYKKNGVHVTANPLWQYRVAPSLCYLWKVAASESWLACLATGLVIQSFYLLFQVIFLSTQIVSVILAVFFRTRLSPAHTSSTTRHVFGTVVGLMLLYWCYGW